MTALLKWINSDLNKASNMPFIFCHPKLLINITFENPENMILLFSFEVFLFSPTPPSLPSLLSPILWLLFFPVGMCVCVCVSPTCCSRPGCVHMESASSGQLESPLTPRLERRALTWSRAARRCCWLQLEPPGCWCCCFHSTQAR